MIERIGRAPRNGQGPQYPAKLDVRLTLEAYQELDHYATEYGLSVSDMARMAIRAGIAPAVDSIERQIERGPDGEAIRL